MELKCCKTCLWWEQDKRPEYPQLGDCCRYPPVAAMQRINSEFGNPQDYWTAERPHMKADDFCGEHADLKGT